VATAIGLAKDVQGDFSGGSFPTYPRDEIPESALEDALNCLIDDNGLPYLRRGSSYATDAAAFTPGQYLFDGNLAGTPQVVVIGGSRFIRIDPTDGHTPVTITSASGVDAILGRKAAQLRGVLFLPGGFGYAGVSATPPALTPATSITLTQGSTTVTGVGTTWSGGAGARGLIVSDATGRMVVVASVTDGTHLELTEPWLDPTVTITAFDVDFVVPLLRSTPVSMDGFNVFGAVGDRLLSARGEGTSAAALATPPNRIYMSDRTKPLTVQRTNYWDLPQGVRVVGIEAYRDTAVVLTSHGIWAIYNVALDLTDVAGNPQQRLEQVTRDLIVWSWAGVVNYESGFIVPCIDGIYTFNPTTGAQEIGKPIKPLYLSYIKAGYIAGHAQFINGHYVLPIIDTFGAAQDLLTCRLSPTRSGVGGQWTRQAAPMRFSSMAVRSAAGSTATLRGLVPATARAVNCSWWDPPSASVIVDYDSTNPQATITTREFRLNSVKNFLAYVKARYELAGTGVSLSAAAGVDGAGTTALTGTGAAGTVANPKVWQVGKRGYGIRLVLTTAGQVSKFTLHSLEAFLRPSGRST
jgi:hypothetical protein